MIVSDIHVIIDMDKRVISKSFKDNHKNTGFKMSRSTDKSGKEIIEAKNILIHSVYTKIVGYKEELIYHNKKGR